jgi:hypothetical protein
MKNISRLVVIDAYLFLFFSSHNGIDVVSQDKHVATMMKNVVEQFDNLNGWILFRFLNYFWINLA